LNEQGPSDDRHDEVSGPRRGVNSTLRKRAIPCIALAADASDLGDALTQLNPECSSPSSMNSAWIRFHHEGEATERDRNAGADRARKCR